ncbi:hypothetical protein [Nocardia aurea]|uniref:Uncharacterized protein n=1 Tax=Nocardia aurea TaxID=2144174 RepID=A0ABV3G4C8_9NOCA
MSTNTNLLVCFGGSVSDHVRVNLDRISTRAAELAGSFGVQAPQIVAGNVPAWVNERLLYSVRHRQPVVIVGAGFDDLSATEQDGALANAIVAGDLYQAGTFKTGFIFGLCATVASLPMAYVAIQQGVPNWVVFSVLAAVYVLGYLLTFALRSRRIVHHVDRRIAEVMGRSVVNSMIDRDIRDRPLLRGFAWLFRTVYSPTESQRVRRLDTSFGSRRIAG